MRTTPNSNRRVGCITLALPFVLLTEFVPAAPPRYDIERVGLYDSEHTSSTGYQQSDALFLRRNGILAGHSTQFNGMAIIGNSAWVYSQGATTRLGLTEGQGPRRSFVLGLNDRGDVLGESALFWGNGNNTYAAWMYRNGETRRIGTIEGVPVYSVRAAAMNSSGQAVGVAYNRLGLDTVGIPAWLYDPETNTNRVIGLTDAAHRNPYWQLPYAEVVGLSETGAATGNTRRYLPNGSDGGTSAWMYNNGANFRIGYFGAQHTNQYGHQQSRSLAINARGEAIGYSVRQQGSMSLGRDSWLYSNGQLVRLGLFDSEHTAGNGQQWESYVDLLNDNGQAAGTSQRYTSGFGNTAWQYSGGVTVPIGIYDAEHTDASGRRVSRPERMNSRGDVAGMSWRYIGTADRGQSAWLYTDSTTTRLGYHDAAYTAPNGSKFTKAVDLNEAGDVIGYSMYYASTSGLGRTGWFFDNASDTLLPLVFSTRSDGARFTDPKIVLDSGIVLGSFTLFDGMTDLGSHVFWWSSAEGFYDLGTLVRDLTVDWYGLVGVYGSGVPGSFDGTYIVGNGRFQGQNNDGSVYLLTDQVPAPATAVVLMAAGSLMFRKRRC